MIDTAGRLHNKSGLMEELKKIVRVIRKMDENAPHDVLLVLDATTGQNAIAQVETFKEMVNVTGLYDEVNQTLCMTGATDITPPGVDVSLSQIK